MAKYKNIIGERFGKLEVISFYGNNPNCKRKDELYVCKCDCGNETIASKSHLLKGEKKSCGCMRKETTSKNYKIHGKTGSRLYRIWMRMKQCCYNPKNPNYKHYGGRGITVCNEWKDDFQSFYEWAMASGYDYNAEFGECTIDRIDVNGNYEPSNCRWTNVDTQSRNKRSNITIEFRGQTKVLKDWAKELGISYNTLYSRLHNSNWDIEKSFTKPVQDCGRKK